jgi:hypothetical protein
MEGTKQDDTPCDGGNAAKKEENIIWKADTEKND